MFLSFVAEKSLVSAEEGKAQTSSQINEPAVTVEQITKTKRGDVPQSTVSVAVHGS